MGINVYVGSYNKCKKYTVCLEYGAWSKVYKSRFIIPEGNNNTWIWCTSVSNDTRIFLMCLLVFHAHKGSKSLDLWFNLVLSFAMACAIFPIHVQYNLSWMDTLIEGHPRDAFWEQCPTFHLLRNLCWRDTSHVAILPWDIEVSP